MGDTHLGCGNDLREGGICLVPTGGREMAGGVALIEKKDSFDRHGLREKIKLLVFHMLPFLGA